MSAPSHMAHHPQMPFADFYQSAHMIYSIPDRVCAPPDMQIVRAYNHWPVTVAGPLVQTGPPLVQPVLKRDRQEETCTMHGALRPGYVRLITPRHGTLEVSWNVFRICLLNMFDNTHVTTTSLKSSEKPKRFEPTDDGGDGYRWRKYGEKALANQNRHRVYYRCTYPNCPAKKRGEVEPSTGIADRVVTTPHNHEPPRKKQRTQPPVESAVKKPQVYRTIALQGMSESQPTMSALVGKEAAITCSPCPPYVVQAR